MMELLAPAGNMDSLCAAIEGGADAVYLGGNTFGARAYANNFSDEELKEAIHFAHLRNVKVHVTVNTLVKTEELVKLAPFLVFLYESGADAILVQDLGVATLAKKIVPNLPLHASTQMSVHNLSGVRALEEFGFSRIVLARELSLEEIRYITKNTRLEIEVFTHGAICISYSGQCLMSSMIGGRSGNRGRCAQPCRLLYKLQFLDRKGTKDEEDKYLLSPKDLNTIDILPQLLASGVASLKIEGRMKRAEYVAIVTDVYRRAIDRLVDAKKYSPFVSEEDERRLHQIFNRDFTHAYLTNAVTKDMMSTTRPNNRGVFIGRVLSYDKTKKRVFVKLKEDVHLGDEVDIWVKVGGRVTEKIQDLKDAQGNNQESVPKGEVASFFLHLPVNKNNRVFRLFDEKLMAYAKKFFQRDVIHRRIFVEALVRVRLGEKFTIRFATGECCGEAQADFLVERAKKIPLTEEAIRKNLERLGGTVYTLCDPLTGVPAIRIDMDENVMVPLSVINDTRRRAIEKLDEMRLAEYRREPVEKIPKIIFEGYKENVSRVKIAISVDTVAKAKLALKYGADIILFGGDSYAEDLTPDMYEEVSYMVKKRGKEFSVLTPRIVREENLSKTRVLLESVRGFQENITAIYVHHLGMAHFVREYTDLPLHADFSMNVCNSLTLETLKGLGFGGATLSLELTLEEIKKMALENPFLEGTNLECIVHGRLELMLSAYNMPSNYGVQSEAKKTPAVLEDRKGEHFPLQIDQFGQMHILNAKTLSMLPHAMKFAPMGIRSIRIEGKSIPPDEYQDLLELYREFSSNKYQSKSHDEVEELARNREKSLLGEDFTRGHYFRGIL